MKINVYLLMRSNGITASNEHAENPFRILWTGAFYIDADKDKKLRMLVLTQVCIDLKVMNVINIVKLLSTSIQLGSILWLGEKNNKTI